MIELVKMGHTIPIGSSNGKTMIFNCVLLPYWTILFWWSILAHWKVDPFMSLLRTGILNNCCVRDTLYSLGTCNNP